MRALLLALLVLTPSSSTERLVLKVSPSVGLAPLETAIRVTVRPFPTDRLLEIVALLDAEPVMVVARAQRDVQTGQPALTVQHRWTLDTGTYVIVACVTGQARGRCVEARVVVR